MTVTVPEAALAENPLARAIRVGDIAANDLAPLAAHLEALLASNAASTALMAHRHHGTRLGEFYALSHESEREAHGLLHAFLIACHRKAEPQPPNDALALAYPGHIARIAITGTQWDYPVSFLHLVRASVRSYQQLCQALAVTHRFDDDQLAHFTYFGHVDDEEITATAALLAEAPADALASAIDTARLLAVYEDLFWDRMVALCAPRPPRTAP